MIKVNFKRQGSSDTLILRGVTENYYAEYHHKTGYLKLEEITQVPKVWKEKTYYETHTKVILSKNYPVNEDATVNFSNIQNDINSLTGLNIQIANYIESYYIGSKLGDRDILNGIDTTEMTVKEVIEICKINLVEFFAAWKRKSLEPTLTNPSEKLLSKKFSELYSFVHWYDINSYKKATEAFQNSI